MARINALHVECSTGECKVRAVVASVVNESSGQAGIKPLIWCRRHGIEELLAERIDVLGRADLNCQDTKCKAKAVLVVLRDDESFIARTCKLHALKLLMGADVADKHAAEDKRAAKTERPRKGK